MSELDSAQQQLVNQRMNWTRVEDRLDRLHAIARAFPLDRLKAGGESPPYYCHYMGWRLGTWSDEAPFERLDSSCRSPNHFPTGRLRRRC